MTDNPILTAILGSVAAFSLAITEIPIIELTRTLTIIARLCGILSFIIILISNWSGFKNQLKEWFK